MSQYIKLTNRTGLHHDLQLKEGLNIDPVPFNPFGNCQPGGIYFTTPEYLCLWVCYRDDLELVWEVEIPEGAQVYHEGEKSKADQLILKNPIAIERYLMTGKEGGLPLTINATYWAAKCGHLELLKYLHDHGCPWDQTTCAYATRNGHLECLMYLHDHGCPWDELSCERAASYGHLKCLKYLHENGRPWTQFASEYAAGNGHLECLKYLHEHGCPWSSFTCAWAADKDHLECLKYLHDHGCPWDDVTCHWAARNSELGCLRYACENQCPGYEEYINRLLLIR